MQKLSLQDQTQDVWRDACFKNDVATSAEIFVLAPKLPRVRRNGDRDGGKCETERNTEVNEGGGGQAAGESRSK